MTGGDQESAHPELDAVVREMKRIRDGCEYYAVTLTANRRNHMTLSSQTEWVGGRHDEKVGRYAKSAWLSLP
jgi:hypothetical protein